MTAKASSQSQPSSELRPGEEWIPYRKASHSVSTAVSGCCQEQGELAEGFEHSTIGGGCRQPNQGVKMALTHYLCSPPLSHANYSQCVFLFSIVVKEIFSADIFLHLLLKTYPSLISNLALLHFRKRDIGDLITETSPLDRVEGLDFHLSKWSDLTAYMKEWVSVLCVLNVFFLCWLLFNSLVWTKAM